MYGSIDVKENSFIRDSNLIGRSSFSLHTVTEWVTPWNIFVAVGDPNRRCFCGILRHSTAKGAPQASIPVPILLFKPHPPMILNHYSAYYVHGKQ